MDYPQLTLTRKFESAQGTFGRLEGPGLSLFTAELPWLGNECGRSRIPAGSYRGAPFSGARFKNVYQLLDVPGREAILIHAGNFAGDLRQGWLSDVRGCILVGTEAGYLRGQLAVLDSRAALSLLRQRLGKREFGLEILEDFMITSEGLREFPQGLGQ